MTLDDLKPFIDWMQANPNWAGFATFIISIAESLAVVGLLIPGTIVMGAIGSLVGSGVLPSLDIVLWASAGAIVGDGISYWLGYHYHGHIREMWPFRSLPGLMQKGETFFLKHGGKSVFLGRFIGPIRPIIPVIAGMMNMPPWRFTLANITSAITWAPAYMLPGYLLGAISVQLAPHTATRFLVMLIIFLLGLWVIYWLLKQLIRLMLIAAHKTLHWLWLWLSRSAYGQPLYRLLAKPGQPQNHSQLTLLLLSIILIVMLIGISILATSQNIYSSGLNSNLWHLARNIRAPELDHIAVSFTLLGELPVLYTLISTIFGWFILRHQWRLAVYWALLCLFVTVTVTIMQITLKIPRPDGLELSLPGWSYPSFHTALGTAVYGSLATILTAQSRKYGAAYLWLSAFIIGFIGLSRIYLGAAWATDMAGGITLGSLSVLLFALALHSRFLNNLANWQLACVSLLALVIPWSWYYSRHFEQEIANYKPCQAKPSISESAWWNIQYSSLPLYRHNLIGEPVELLNVQWLGKLNAITHSLMQQGWHLAPKPNTAIILNRIAAKNRETQLPLFPPLYAHSRPVITMIKMVPAQNKMLVLRLWNAPVTLADDNQPLWLGIISYHQPWKLHFSHKAITTKSYNGYNYPAAMQTLTLDLANHFQVKQVPVRPALCKGIEKRCSPAILQIAPESA